MKWTQRILNAVQNGRRQQRPKPGQLISPRPEDAWRDYPSSGLTPSRLMSILREADAGSLSAAMQLFEEIEEKDAHLYAVANMRRLAVTGLQWKVISAADVRDGVDRVAADEAAAYCAEVLGQIDGFDEALQHLSLAFGRNISLAELVWETTGRELRLVDVCPVDFGRIVLDDLGGPRILTSEQPQDGIALPPNKFIVHTPHNVAGHVTRGGLLRVTAMMYLAKNLTFKDWLIFAEVFGMPVRIARYEPSATAADKRELLNMLESIGSNAAGIFSRAVELQFIEAGRGTQGPPYERLVDFANREMSKAWLGQTLTTETTGQTGTFAASTVHEEVRKDVRADDIRKEGRTIRRDLLGPMARIQFGGMVPVPFFHRAPNRPRELRALTDLLDTAVNRLGIRVPLEWAHQTLSIPQPDGDEAVLSGSSERMPPAGGLPAD
jgi:phage gp29-like protein